MSEPTEETKDPAAPPPTLTSFLAFVEEVSGVLGAAATTATSGSVPAWRVAPGDLREAARRLRDAGWDYLLFMTAVDYPKENRFEVVYLVSRFADARHLALLADIDRAAPAIASVHDVWAAADWHEREAYDMFGIRFEGHPFLRRILLDEDWPGHPLRKDYVDTLHDVQKRPS